jgi:hypothetical protein
MSWTWQLETADGTPLVPPAAPASPPHPTQSDAKSWLGEQWRELREAGVAQVSLRCGGEPVYGPMSLTDD